MSEALRFCPRCATPLLRQEHAGRERDLCPACGWVHWDNPLPVIAALIEYNGKVLLARNAAWAPGRFAMVTGFLERDETPEQGLAREIMEETSLSVASSHLIGVYEFMRKNELIIAYHVIAMGEIKLGEELLEYRLIEPEKLKPWPQGTGLAMADWLRARGLPVEFRPLGS